jgi:hypothetical protein
MPLPVSPSNDCDVITQIGGHSFVAQTGHPSVAQALAHPLQRHFPRPGQHGLSQQGQGRSAVGQEPVVEFL